jgi:ribosome-associated protein
VALHVDATLQIPDAEIRFTASRSSGPGGQHVNKAATRVTLEFDVAASQCLSAEQKARIAERLGRRLAGGSLLRVTVQEARSQAANRRRAEQRLADLLRRALAPPPPPRRPTHPSLAARARRLEAKRKRARLKELRRVEEG